jgi:hypothetical protein
MWRRDLAIIVLFMGGLILVCVGSGTGVKPLIAVGCLVAGVGCAVQMIECHREGVIRTNAGILRRSDCRLCFRFQVGFWWTVVLLWTLGGVLHGFGWLIR